MKQPQSHFGQRGYVVIWTILGAMFLIFTPFYKKSQRKPATFTSPLWWRWPSKCSASQ